MHNMPSPLLFLQAMLEFLRQKEQKHKENRSLSRTETSHNKLRKPATQYSTRAQNMAKAASVKGFNEWRGDKKIQHQKKRSLGMLQMYFSKDSAKIQPANPTQSASRRDSRSSSAADLHQSQIVKIIQQAKEKAAHRVVIQRALKSYKQLQTVGGTLTTLNTNRQLLISTKNSDLDLELERKKSLLQKSLENSKSKILGAINPLSSALANKNSMHKALVLRQVLSGKEESVRQSQIDRMKKQYESKNSQINRQQLLKRDRQRAQVQRKEAERETQKRNFEEQKWRQRMQYEAERRQFQQENKMEAMKQTELKRKIKQQKIQPEARITKKQSNPTPKISEQNKFEPRQKSHFAHEKQEDSFTILNLIAPQSTPKPPQNIQEPKLDFINQQIPELGVVIRAPKQQKKNELKYPVTTTQNTNVKKTKDIPKRNPQKLKPEDDDQLQEIVLQKSKVFEKSQIKAQISKIPQKPPMPPSILAQQPKPQVIIQKKPPLPQRPCPAQNTRPSDNIFNQPSQRPASSPKQSHSDENDEQQEVDIDEMKLKLNMVGQTIGYGSKDLKGISVSWTVPCFFLYRKFYQLRIMLLKQFEILEKENIVARQQIQQIEAQNEKVKISLQKMAAACEKKCNNPTLKPKFKEKFQSNVNKALYDTTDLYFQEIENAKRTLSPEQHLKAKLHLLQILNSILIVQQFQGKKTEPLTAEQLFSAKAKANIDPLLKQHYGKVVKFRTK